MYYPIWIFASYYDILSLIHHVGRQCFKKSQPSKVELSIDHHINLPCATHFGHSYHVRSSPWARPSLIDLNWSLVDVKKISIYLLTNLGLILSFHSLIYATIGHWDGDWQRLWACINVGYVSGQYMMALLTKTQPQLEQGILYEIVVC